MSVENVLLDPFRLEVALLLLRNELSPSVSYGPELIGEYSRDIVFSPDSTAGISKDFQLTYPSLSDLVVKSAMIRSAENIYLVADSDKIGNTSFATLGRISLVDALISDNNLGKEVVQKLKEMNVKVI